MSGVLDSDNNRILKMGTNGMIATVAGVGPSPPNVGFYSGDGGAATNAHLYGPVDVVLDAIGDLYIADSQNCRVRKVNSQGIIITIAGNGNYGYSGDGGAATNACIWQPYGLALDASGELYLADSDNERIRKVGSNGIISTVAGNGGDAYSGDGGTATNASLNDPQGMDLDVFRNLFFADTGNNRIRELTTNGIIITVAGNGSMYYSGDGSLATNASLYSPTDAAFDAGGHLIIADTYNNRIREVDTNGIISTLAGNGYGADGSGSGAFSGDGGAATNASLWFPTGLAFDAIGNLYFADSGNFRVREIHFAGLPTLPLNNISTTNSGNYGVVIANACGSVTSAVATLTVLLPPAIVVQPMIQGNSNAVLSVTATGTRPLYYSWYLNSNTLVQNSTNSTLVVTNVSAINVGPYLVVVTNAYGSATSQVATLWYPSSVVSQPASLMVLPGSNVTFNVTACGAEPLNYQWQFNGTNLPNNVIITVAGGGSTNPGDDGPATNATLSWVSGIACDNQGNFYIADYYHGRIRKVDTNGIITTVAGNGNLGYSGDGGSATNASLDYPDGVAVDALGNLFVAEVSDNRIRKVDTNGIIVTVAGNGTSGYSGDNDTATNASLNYPSGVAVDSIGNLYIADCDNNRIRQVNTNGIISTVAGNGSFGYSGDGAVATNASLRYPAGVAVDQLGNLYIADTYNMRVRQVDTHGVIVTVAGNGSSTFAGDGGVATNAGLYYPNAVVLDSFGYMYIADGGDRHVRQVDLNSVISTVAGNGSAAFSGDGGAATNASLNGPAGVSVAASGSLLIADEQNNRVREITLGRSSSLFLGSVNENNAGNYEVVILNPYGNGCVTSSVATLTVMVPPIITAQPLSLILTNGGLAQFAVSTVGPGPVGYQWYFNTNAIAGGTNATLSFSAVAYGQAGNYFCVITNVYGLTTSRSALLTLQAPPNITFQSTNQLVISGSSVTFNVVVSGSGPFTYQWQCNGTNLPNNNNLIATVAGEWQQTGYNGDGVLATNAALFDPAGVAIDPAGDFFIADTWNNRVRKVNTNNIITTLAGIGPGGTGGSYSGDGGPGTSAGLNLPFGVAVDALGNCFIADTANNRIRKVDTHGIITTVAGTNSWGYTGDGGSAVNAVLRSPSGVAFDNSGNLFIADTGNQVIREVGTNGIITTVAGSGPYNRSYAGDGGLATNASLYNPYGVAVDNSGNVFIADEGNNRIRKVDVNGYITTLAGNGTANYSGDGGLATNATLNQPYGVAVDAFDDVFIADYANNRIRMVAASGLIFTVAGNGAAGQWGDEGIATNANLYEPEGVGLDAYGNLFIAGNIYSTIRRVQLVSAPALKLNYATAANAGNYDAVISSPYGCVTSSVVTLGVVGIVQQPSSMTVTNGGSASFTFAVSGLNSLDYQWFLNTNTAVAGGTNATLSLANVGTNQVGAYFCEVSSSSVSLTSRVVSLTIGLSPSITLQPTNQTAFGGSTAALSVAVSGTGPFTFKWQLNGTNLPNSIIMTVAGGGSINPGDGGPATNAKLNQPNDAYPDSAGNLLISDELNNRVRKVDANGIITTVAGRGIGAFSGDGGTATNALVDYPCAATVDGYGNLFIADNRNNRIRKVDVTGIITTVAGGGTVPGKLADGGAATNASLGAPTDVLMDPCGNLIIAEQQFNRIRKVDNNGIITTVAGGGTSNIGDGGAATNAELNSPFSLALDGIGNLYIADLGNERIRKVGTNGIITTVAGTNTSGFSGDGGLATNARLYTPFGVAVDPFGNLFIADTRNNRIREVDTNGIISTVVGTGSASFSGDGGPATAASLNFPLHISLDDSGNLFIADQQNNRIREVRYGGSPTLVLSNLNLNNAGNYSVVVSGPYGNATSSSAALIVIVAPQGFAGNLSNGIGLQLQFSGTPNHPYTLQSATNLSPPINWQPIVTNSTDTNGNWSFTDTNISPFPQKFYRAFP